VKWESQEAKASAHYVANMPKKDNIAWTLRLKREKTTVFLFADPSQTLTELKQTLLDSLHQTHPSKKLDGTPIPQSTTDVELALPINDKDLSLGWRSIDFIPDEDARAAKNSGATLRTAGIQENGVLAFRFRGGDDEANDETLGEELTFKVQIPEWDEGIQAPVDGSEAE
jgi:hypothetical protein